MILEYMNRGCLQSWVKKNGPLNEACTSHITRQILIGLAQLHSRFQVHRDIKPANILIDNTGHVKISDFGLMKQLDGTSAFTKSFVGTMIYLSPERISGNNTEYSYSSDIWSLGISLMFLVTGELPFNQKVFHSVFCKSYSSI